MDFDQTCRCCMVRIKQPGKLRPLFSGSMDAMLREVTRLPLDISDGLPSQICVPCMQQTSRAFTFYRQCRKSDAILREHLKTPHEDQQVDPVSEVIESILEQQQPSNDIPEFYETIEIVEEGPLFEVDPTTTADSVYENVLSELSCLEQDDAQPAAMQIEDYACNKCAMVYSTMEGLANHEGRVHPPEPGDSSCEICDKKFTTQKAIRRHMNVHRKTHKCEECGAAFSEKVNLNKHLNSHTGALRNVREKAFACNDCEKTFKWKTSLDKHAKIHTGRKLHRCDVCPRAFTEAKGLQLHKATHSTDAQQFVCGTCSKTFNNEMNLKRHLLIHTDEKPFKCKECGKSFRQSAHLNYHLSTHNKKGKIKKRSGNKGG